MGTGIRQTDMRDVGHKASDITATQVATKVRETEKDG